jgi:hypothetical protein
VRLLALAVPISSACSVVALCRLIYGPLTPRVLGSLVVDVVRPAVAALATFVPCVLVARELSVSLADWIGGVAGLASFALAVWLALPRERELGARLAVAVRASLARAGR